MTVEIDEDNLSKGLLGLVMALVEIIRDVLEEQALRRMEGEELTDDEVERLGTSLMELDKAIQSIKDQHELEDTVDQVKSSLDDVADEALRTLIDPEKWREQQIASH